MENGGKVGLELDASYPIGGVGNVVVFGLEAGLELPCMSIFQYKTIWTKNWTKFICK